MNEEPQYEIERIEEQPSGSRQESFYSYRFESGSPMPWKVKLIIWGLALGGIVLGTLLFLFFLTVFVYLFVPALIVFFLWQFFNRRR